MKQETLSKEDVLFIPDTAYIDLLQEYAYMYRNGVKNTRYRIVKQMLCDIEVAMPAGDIIRNTKTAFKN